MLESVLVSAINHLLRDADWARARLSPHAHRTARIEAGRLRVSLAVRDDGYLELPPNADADPDLVLEFPASAFPRGLDGREALLQAASMRGQIEFAEALGFVLRNLRWDVEDDLSRLTGDIAARRIVRTGDRLRHSLVDSIGRLGEAVSEYVLHEAAVAAPVEAVVGYCREVDDLCDQLERVDARLRRLESAVAGR